MGDLYTDPQIHCRSDIQAFGLGNGGQEGIDLFIRTHECNALCSYLKLPVLYSQKGNDRGTHISNNYLERKNRSYLDLDPVKMPQRTYEKPCCCNII